MDYPEWSLFPRHLSSPVWVEEFIQIVQKNQPEINSYEHNKFESDAVLKALEPDLESKGWQVETGKKDKQKIFRPVLYGDGGKTRVSYEIDGWNPEHKIGNAFYRDLIRTSIIQDADFLILGMRLSYSYGNVKNQNDYLKAKEQLDAVYASGRLSLPFKGILIFGW
jgi:hypothetical protein